MKNLLHVFVILFLTPPQYLAAQNPAIDSFLRLTQSPTDTVRALAYTDLASIMLAQDIQLAKKYLDTAQQLTKGLPEGRLVQKMLAVRAIICLRLHNTKRLTSVI